MTKEKWYSTEETAHSWAKNVYEKEATKSQIAKNKDWGMYVDGPTATAEHFKQHWPDKNEIKWEHKKWKQEWQDKKYLAATDKAHKAEVAKEASYRKRANHAIKKMQEQNP